MLVGRGEDLVAGPEVEPGQDAHDAVARARRQRDVGRRRRRAPPRRPRAGGRAARAASRRTPSRALRGAAVEHRQGRSHGRVRERPARAGVQVGAVLEDRELGAQGGGVHPRQAMAYRPQTGQGDAPALRVEHAPRGGPARPRAPRPGRRCRRRAPRCRSRTGTCRGRRRRRRRRAGCRRTRMRRSTAATAGTGTSGAPPVRRSARMSRAQRTALAAQARQRPRLHAAHVRAAHVAMTREPGLAPRQVQHVVLGLAVAPAPRRPGCAARARRRGRGRRRRGPPRRGRRSTAHAPHTARSFLGFIVEVTSNGRRMRTRVNAHAAAPFRVQASGSTAAAIWSSTERRREAGATPRRGRVSGTLRSRANRRP